MRVQYEHPTQLLAAGFLRAVAEDDAAGIWDRLSLETRGLLEGRDASARGIALHRAADAAALDRARLVAPLRASMLAVAGDPARIGGLGVSAARIVDRATAYVLLIPEFGEERIVAETDWRPAHLLAFVNERRDWFVDLGRTATLSAEAELPDPLGEIR